MFVTEQIQEQAGLLKTEGKKKKALTVKLQVHISWVMHRQVIKMWFAVLKVTYVILSV